MLKIGTIEDLRARVERVPGPAEKAGISPTLATAVDLWGQVVAHRVGCRGSALILAKRDIRGGWMLQRDWRTAMGDEIGFPERPVLAPWARAIAARAPAPAPASRGPELAFGSLHHKGDVRGVQLAFLTMDTLLREEYLWRVRWGKRGQGLLAWLFVVPYVFGPHADLDVAGWCAREYGPRCDGEAIARTEAVLKAWAHHANRRIANVMPEMDDELRRIEATPVARRVL